MDAVPSMDTPCRWGCSGVCTDLNADPLNCGSCGVRCAPGGACVAGTCTGGLDATVPDEVRLAAAELLAHLDSCAAETRS